MSKTTFRLMSMGLLAVAALMATSCDTDPDEYSFSRTYVVTFDNAPAAVVADDDYGTNYYPGAADQVTTGYMVEVTNGTYLQFPVNYAQQTWLEGQPWQYTYSNGGLAVSDRNNQTVATYLNQMSVYDKGGVSGSNFLIANGSCLYDDYTTTQYSDYDRCGRIYVTDKLGYTASADGGVDGTKKYLSFMGLYLANTTYAYLAMRDGNDFTTDRKSLKDQQGWFAVDFVGFRSTDPTAKPVGKVRYYLANYDPANVGIAQDFLSSGWEYVAFDSEAGLDDVCVLVVNLLGSDASAWGLNTPAYIALDNIKVKVTSDKPLTNTNSTL